MLDRLVYDRPPTHPRFHVRRYRDDRALCGSHPKQWGATKPVTYVSGPIGDWNGEPPDNICDRCMGAIPRSHDVGWAEHQVMVSASERTH